MPYNVTKEQLQHFIINDVDLWIAPFNTILAKYEINTRLRVAAFTAQCAHESMKFKALKENLNYSAKGLNTVFPKYFKNAGRDANAYARQPEKIANIVYASRLGNGNTASGDGWKFRGRGVIQLTGRENYANFGKTIDLTPEEVSTYLETRQGALESACWYWSTRNLNVLADTGDIKELTRRINGGYRGLEDRISLYKKALSVFK